MFLTNPGNLAFFCAGSINFGCGFYFLVKVLRYGRFPSVRADVLTKNVGPSRVGDGYEPVIYYTYTVRDTAYTSSRICSLSGWSYGSQHSAEYFIKKVAPETCVMVRYDPNNPGFSFVKNGPYGTIFLFMFIGLSFMGLSTLTMR